MRLNPPLWIVFLVCHWLVCGFVAWNLLASGDFAYSAAYRWLDIDQHIATYAPQNRNRNNFALTDKAQHLELFHQINLAVHRAPETLEQIRFYPARGESQTLLTPAEVGHLTDVARLIDKLYQLGWCACIALSLSGVLLWHRQGTSPPPRPGRCLSDRDTDRGACPGVRDRAEKSVLLLAYLGFPSRPPLVFLLSGFTDDHADESAGPVWFYRRFTPGALAYFMGGIPVNYHPALA